MTPVTRPLHVQARTFFFIGIVGFIVDGGILTLLHARLDFSPVSARFVSFPIALSTTWLLNRHFTFTQREDRHIGKEWLLYALVNTTGALLNLGCFIFLVRTWDQLAAYPIVPLAMAAAIAMLFNFTGSRFLVFGNTK